MVLTVDIVEEACEGGCNVPKVRCRLGVFEAGKIFPEVNPKECVNGMYEEENRHIRNGVDSPAINWVRPTSEKCKRPPRSSREFCGEGIKHEGNSFDRAGKGLANAMRSEEYELTLRSRQVWPVEPRP